MATPTETVSAEEYYRRERMAMDRKKAGPVKIRQMSEAERIGFALDLAEIRRRGMFGR